MWSQGWGWYTKCLQWKFYTLASYEPQFDSELPSSPCKERNKTSYFTQDVCENKNNHVLNSKTRMAFLPCVFIGNKGSHWTHRSVRFVCMLPCTEPIFLNPWSIPLGKRSANQDLAWARNVTIRFIFSGQLILTPVPLWTVIMKSPMSICPNTYILDLINWGTRGLLKMHRMRRIGTEAGSPWWVLALRSTPWTQPSFYLIVCKVELRRRQWHPLQYSCLENPMDGGAW